MFTKINFASSIRASNIIIRPFSLVVHSIISTSRDGLNMITVPLLCFEP